MRANQTKYETRSCGYRTIPSMRLFVVNKDLGKNEHF